MSEWIWCVGGLVLLLSSAAQSAIGFGSALFATPILVWMGMELPHAVTLVSTCSMLQSALAAHELRRDIPWRLVGEATAIRLAFVLLGLVFMKAVLRLGADKTRLALGAVLAMATMMQLASDRPRLPRLSWGWNALAFSTSGLMAGFSGMGGPPLVLWAMAHDWSPRRIRGFLFAVFAASTPVQIGLLRLSFDRRIWTFSALGIAAFPLLWLGSRIGMPIGNRLSHRTLTRLAGGVLLLISFSAILQSVIALTRQRAT